MLIDPYDIDTLQIFFDTDILKNPEKIDVVDIATKKRLDLNYTLGKFVVNVEPNRAIVDSNYFINKIDECINNRKAEIQKMFMMDLPIIPTSEEINYEEEMKKLAGDTYLQMTVMPLLQNAMNMCEILRPSDPIAFIGNFMLTHKSSVKNIQDIIRELPNVSLNKEVINENIAFDDEDEQLAEGVQMEEQTIKKALETTAKKGMEI